MPSPHQNQQQLGLACARRSGPVRTSTWLAQTDVGSGEHGELDWKKKSVGASHLIRISGAPTATPRPVGTRSPFPPLAPTSPIRPARVSTQPLCWSPRPTGCSLAAEHPGCLGGVREELRTRDICRPGKPSTTTTTTTPRRKRKRKAGPMASPQELLGLTGPMARPPPGQPLPGHSDRTARGPQGPIPPRAALAQPAPSLNKTTTTTTRMK